MPSAKTAISIGVLVLATAFLIPTAHDAVSNDAVRTADLAGGQAYDLTDSLRVTATNVNSTAGNVTLSYQNTRTLNTTTVTINESSNATVSLSGDYLDVYVGQITASETARVETVYPPMFGWSDGPRTFMSNLPVVIILIAAIILFGLVGVVKR